MKIGNIQFQGKRGVAFLIGGLIIGLLFWPFALAALLCYLVYKKIRNKSVRAALLALIVLLALFVGVSWVRALFGPAGDTPKKTAAVTQPPPSATVEPAALASETPVAAESPGSVLATSSQTQGEGVLVTKVIDGDTITLETGAVVRYIGIDTPETVHPSKPVQ